MFSCFHDAYTKEKSKGLKEDKIAEKWWDFLSQVEQAKPDWASYLTPKENELCRSKIYNIVTNNNFDNFIMSIIILNLCTMGMNYDNEGQVYSDVLDYINLTFTSIFILESLSKIVALGFTRYFLNAWNRFDFFVVVASIVDICVTYGTAGSGNNTQYLKSLQIIRVLRVLRVTR